MFDYLTMT